LAWREPTTIGCFGAGVTRARSASANVKMEMWTKKVAAVFASTQPLRAGSTTPPVAGNYFTDFDF
jgi:hypothetical protein